MAACDSSTRTLAFLGPNVVVATVVVVEGVVSVVEVVEVVEIVEVVEVVGIVEVDVDLLLDVYK